MICIGSRRLWEGLARNTLGYIQVCINDSQCVIRKLLGLKKALEPILSFVSRRIRTAHSPGLRAKSFSHLSQRYWCWKHAWAICKRRWVQRQPCWCPPPPVAFKGQRQTDMPPSSYSHSATPAACCTTFGSYPYRGYGNLIKQSIFFFFFLT